MSEQKMWEALELAREAIESHYPNHREYKVAAALIALAEQPAQGETCKAGHNPDRCDRETCNVLAVCFAAPPAPSVPERSA